VYLTARGSERGRPAAATVGTRFLELDVTSGESVRHAAGCVERAEGHLDVLVNKPASPARCVTTRTTTRPAT
jgi:NAD(P)-dependent dehydrogenase (short-subunit alcohol dehydrogenase family)